MALSIGEQQIVDQLYKLLANTYVLYTKTQGFHWNVTDARFYMLHKFFEEQYEELAEALDVIAEHIRTFKVVALGSLSQMLEFASVKESGEVKDGDVMVAELYHDHSLISAQIRHTILLADELHDASTSDMLVGRLRAHEKITWMLRSHLPENSLVGV